MPRIDRKLPLRIVSLPDGFISDGDHGKPPSGPDKPYKPDDGRLLHTVGRHLAKHQGRDISKYDFKLDQFPDGYSGWFKERPAGNRPPDRYIYGHPSKGNFFSSGALFAQHLLYRLDHGNSTGCGCTTCVEAKSKTTRMRRRAGSIDEDTEYDDAATSSQSDETSDGGSILLEPRIITEVLNSSQEPAVEPAFVTDSIVDDSINDDLQRSDCSTSNGRRAGSSDENGSHSGPTPILNDRSDSMHELLDRAKHLKLNQHLEQDIRAASCLYGLENQIDVQAQLEVWRRTPNMLRYGELVICHISHQSLSAATSPTCSHWFLGVIASTTEVFENSSNIEVHSLEQAELSQQFSVENVCPLKFMSYLDKYSSRTLEQKVQTFICKFSLISAFHIKAERERLSETISTLSFTGIYIGAELLLLGDYVRLLPRALEQDDSIVTDIMLLQAIQLRIVQSDDNEEGHLACHVSGSVWTTERSRAFKINGRLQLCSDEEARKILGEDGTLYWRTNPDIETAWMEIPFTRILGRYHHARCHAKWLAAFGQRQKPCSTSSPDSHLSFGLHDTLRMHHRAHNNLSSIGKIWRWEECRLLS